METTKKKLAELTAGETFKVGEHEFIVLEHTEAGTACLAKDIITKMIFGKNNNFAESDVRKKLAELAAGIEAIVGEGNLVEHEVDLTSDDGLDDYGACEAKVSLLTAPMYRRYVRIIDKYNLNCWWWTATAYSTPTHEDDYWVKCVSPRGSFINVNYDGSSSCVRPFCIFASDIFVS